MKTIACIVGARPNFVKIAPILRSIKNLDGFDACLIHTGQHYDVAMNQAFFSELNIPDPDVNLEVGSGTATAQTAQIMIALEPVLQRVGADIVLVVGDVNSTVAGALVAARLHLPVVHVEAGLRSRDLTMPEEVNRLVTDRLSALLLTSEKSGDAALAAEGIPPEQIKFVGNVMIDTLHACLDRAVPTVDTIAKHRLDKQFEPRPDEYGFVTLHRPSNVDDPGRLKAFVSALNKVALRFPLIFAVHPRTANRLEEANLSGKLDSSRILATPPLSYLETLGVQQDACAVITDSGGLQDETSALGVPCFTVRDNTERPVTIEEGTNTLVGACPDALVTAIEVFDAGNSKSGRVPPLWDGRASVRVCDAIANRFDQ